MTEHLLLHIAVVLLAAKLAGELCERVLCQPAVLGEIVVGALLGGSLLGWIPAQDIVLDQMAEIGAVFLLFEVGLDTDLKDLMHVGGAAVWVACAGVALPFALGYAATAAMGWPHAQAVFAGAALTATSVGITARVFSDLKALHSREARIVLGAAVADDVIGLIILAAVSGLATTGRVSALGLARTTGVALGFLAGALLVGLWATPVLLRAARRMQTRAAVSTAAVAFCLLVSCAATAAGLAPIVGAFAAGVVLARADERVHIEERVRPVSDLFVPLFFVLMGARMNLSCFNLASSSGRATVGIGLVLLACAIVGKVLGSLTVPGRGLRRMVIGVGMIPRGEVGLIFATIGLRGHMIGDGLYAAVIFVVICTTFVTPPLLKMLIRRGGHADARRLVEYAVGPARAGKREEALRSGR